VEPLDTCVAETGRSSVQLRHASVVGLAAGVGSFGAVAAVVGGVLGNHMSDRVSNVLFAAVLVLVAVSQLWSLRSETSDPLGSTADRS
jgi:uncharacterized membrane protein YfcA